MRSSRAKRGPPDSTSCPSSEVQFPVACVVEGRTDEPAVLRLMQEVGLPLGGPRRITGGKSNLDQGLPGWNKSALRLPWLVVRDLDHDDRNTCVPALRQRLLGGTGPNIGMCFRLAVRSIEAWLIADHESFRTYFGITKRLPRNPDGLEDPKSELMHLCERSRKRDIREGVPPRRGSGRKHGPEYLDAISNYCWSHWNPARARQLSPSLDRAMQDMVRLHNWP